MPSAQCLLNASQPSPAQIYDIHLDYKANETMSHQSSLVRNRKYYMYGGITFTSELSDLSVANVAIYLSTELALSVGEIITDPYPKVNFKIR